MKLALLPEDITSLTDQQKLAVLEALTVGVLADGLVHTAEVAEFNEVVGRLPWGMDKPALLALIESSQQRVAALATPQQVADFIIGLAARLPTPEIRDKVFFSMASVMYGDREMNQREQNVLSAFVLAFGITQDRLQAIKKSVRRP